MKSTVKVALALFAYGGNGGTSSLIPELAVWLAKAYHRLKSDSRVEDVQMAIYSDTPIYMTRNRAVKDALDGGYDMLLMLDSDNEPDAYWGRDPEAKLFLNEPFAFAFERLKQGIPTVMMAPYCGPPPHPLPSPGVTDNGEVPYMFQWTNIESDCPDAGWKQAMLTRNEAEKIKGIYPMSSGPTGVSLFTTNVFDGPPKPYFDYEMDQDKTEKRGTEDCFCTRNLSLYWKMTKGWDVCYAACDSWALHHKPKRVGRPRTATLEIVAKEMQDAIRDNHSLADTMRIVDYTGNLPDHIGRRGTTLRHDQNEVYLTAEDLEEARILGEREALAEKVYDRWGGKEKFAEAYQEEVNLLKTKEKLQAAVEAQEAAGTLWQAPAVDPDYCVVTGTNDGRQLFNDKGHISLAPNGDALKYRMIGNRKIAAIGTEISDQTIEKIEDLAIWLVTNNGALEVAVAHAGSGQSAAAILSMLPDGSHLYARDSVNTYQFSAQPAEQFTKSFQPELESGRVMADLHSRKFPWPEEQQHLDLVFIERSLTSEKLFWWYKHVRTGGVLAGLGYDDPKTRKLVDTFVESGSLKIKAAGDVWAIPK